MKAAQEKSKPAAVTSSTKKPATVVSGAEKITTAEPKPKMDDKDILKGAGLFKFKNNQELLKKWKIVNPERYDIKLGTEDKENTVALTKKKDAP